ncbi:unnamed protein product [Staurois parvus]|uniref:Uncharacterized protein n=1 Tax=Staurois parvus TaxID=386267 RepID=A0ABN9BFK7_9NEOB|nr:unnamed protein product [Staurois parvus]
MFFREVHSLLPSEISHGEKPYFCLEMREMFFTEVQSLYTSAISYR